MKNKPMKSFDNFQKASHYALWLDFKYRNAEANFLVCQTKDNTFKVCSESQVEEVHGKIMSPIAQDLADLSFEDISTIAKEDDPLLCWETIRSMFTSVDNTVLMFILNHNIPMETFIRHELAARGFDKANRWVGFDKSEAIWKSES